MSAPRETVRRGRPSAGRRAPRSCRRDRPQPVLRRKWLAAAGIWTTRRERLKQPHQPRHRRDCLGELVQIDGCDHEWFEGRGPRCTLLVYVDDATGKLMELRFVESESAFDYFRSTIGYLKRHGKPVAFYSDKHSIFRVYAEGATGRSKGVTQFGRALGKLNIDIICANSPQAKVVVSQGAVVESKRLGAVLSLIQAKQTERDTARSASNGRAPAAALPVARHQHLFHPLPCIRSSDAERAEWGS